MYFMLVSSCKFYISNPQPQPKPQRMGADVEKLICMPEYSHVRSENQRVLNWYSSHNIHTLSWNDTKLCFFGLYILRFHSCFYFSPTQTNQSFFLPLNSTRAYSQCHIFDISILLFHFSPELSCQFWLVQVLFPLFWPSFLISDLLFKKEFDYLLRSNVSLFYYLLCWDVILRWYSK